MAKPAPDRRTTKRFVRYAGDEAPVEVSWGFGYDKVTVRRGSVTLAHDVDGATVRRWLKLRLPDGEVLAVRLEATLLGRRWFVSIDGVPLFDPQQGVTSADVGALLPILATGVAGLFVSAGIVMLLHSDPRVVVVTAGDLPRTIYVDGRERGRVPWRPAFLALELTPGSHELCAGAPGTRRRVCSRRTLSRNSRWLWNPGREARFVRREVTYAARNPPPPVVVPLPRAEWHDLTGYEYVIEALPRTVQVGTFSTRTVVGLGRTPSDNVRLGLYNDTDAPRVYRFDDRAIDVDAGTFQTIDVREGPHRMGWDAPVPETLADHGDYLAVASGRRTVTHCVVADARVEARELVVGEPLFRIEDAAAVYGEPTVSYERLERPVAGWIDVRGSTCERPSVLASD